MLRACICPPPPTPFSLSLTLLKSGGAGLALERLGSEGFERGEGAVGRGEGGGDLSAVLRELDADGHHAVVRRRGEHCFKVSRELSVAGCFACALQCLDEKGHWVGRLGHDNVLHEVANDAAAARVRVHHVLLKSTKTKQTGTQRKRLHHHQRRVGRARRMRGRGVEPGGVCVCVCVKGVHSEKEEESRVSAQCINKYVCMSSCIYNAIVGIYSVSEQALMEYETASPVAEASVGQRKSE